MGGRIDCASCGDAPLANCAGSGYLRPFEGQDLVLCMLLSLQHTQNLKPTNPVTYPIPKTVSIQ